MINVSKVRRLHGLRTAAEILRRRFGLGVGLLTTKGDVVPLGSENYRFEVPACLAFRGRMDDRGSCRESVLHWSRHALHNPDEFWKTECHAGLSAMVLPVVARDQVVCAVYCSGFLRRETAREQKQRIDRRAADLAIGGVDAPMMLDSHERGRIEDVVRTIRDEVQRYLEQELPVRADRARFGIIGHSAVLLELFQTLHRLQHSEATVLIQGENGTGKELVARAVHINSPRRNRPLVVTNCSALNDNLLNSELFGHKRGAFTGALNDKQGLFDVADGGTFFLDELGDMSPSLQLKLLRVLQEGTFTPVGDTVMHKVDVRIIAATNRDLERMVREGTFREDLYYRINVINIVCPPLRERIEDVPELVDYFLEKASRNMGIEPIPLSVSVVQRMMQYHWPGNVRQLENEIERLLVLARGMDEVPESLLSQHILREAIGSDDSVSSETMAEAVERLEKRMIMAALRATGWNKSHAAQKLGVSRRNLIRKVQRYGLETLRAMALESKRQSEES